MRESICGPGREHLRPVGWNEVGYHCGDLERGSTHLEDDVSIIVVELQGPDRANGGCGHCHKICEGNRLAFI